MPYPLASLAPSRTRSILTAAHLLALLGLAGCSEEENPAPSPPRVALVEPLRTAAPAPKALRFAGVVESVTSTELSFQVAGRIERILVDEGKRVARGQPLAELDDTDYQLQLREARARHAQLQADLARKRTLLAEGILAPAAIEPLEANLVAARVAQDSALRNIAHSTLTAPFDGVIAQRLAEPDMVVSTGTPILRMQDNRHIEVGVDLPDTAALTVPLNAELQANGELVNAELSIPLRYKEHSTQPREGSRTYRLILQGEPPKDFNLLPGMAMRVSLQHPAAPAEATADSYRVPLSALQTAADGQHFVWFAVDGQARRQDLVLQRLEREHALVGGSLEEGSLVIVAGGSKLTEGQNVKPEQRN